MQRLCPLANYLIFWRLKGTEKHWRTITVQSPRRVHHHATQPFHSRRETLLAGGETPAYEAFAGEPESRSGRQAETGVAFCVIGFWFSTAVHLF